MVHPPLILQKLHADPICREALLNGTPQQLTGLPQAQRVLEPEELAWVDRLDAESLRRHVDHWRAAAPTGNHRDELRRATHAGSSPRAGGGFVGVSRSELEAKLERRQQTDATMEESRKLLQQRYGTRGPGTPGARLRDRGEPYLYIHRIGATDKAKPEVLRSIAEHGLRSAQATGVFGQGEGVYALDMTGGELPGKLYAGDVYALFISSHPCVVGEHVNRNTALFPLSEGRFIDTRHCVFLRPEKDGTYSLLDEGGERRGELPAVDGRLPEGFDLRSHCPEASARGR